MEQQKMHSLHAGQPRAWQGQFTTTSWISSTSLSSISLLPTIFVVDMSCRLLRLLGAIVNSFERR
jgi:hypothetical protein